MDEKLRQRFMIAASSIGPPGIFRRHGGSLREFLDDFVSNTDTAKDVAVKVFEYFCWMTTHSTVSFREFNLRSRFWTRLPAGHQTLSNVSNR